MSRFVDFSEKYGVGFELSNNAFGVLFNDDSCLVRDERRERLFYWQKSGSKEVRNVFAYSDIPDDVEMKKLLLEKFEGMTEDSEPPMVIKVPWTETNNWEHAKDGVFVTKFKMD